MPIPGLDSRTALNVIDLQAGSVDVDRAPHTEVSARTAAPADASRACDLPVVVVNVAATVQQPFKLGFHVTTPINAVTAPDPAKMHLACAIGGLSQLCMPARSSSQS